LPFWLRPHGFSFRWLPAIEFLIATLLFHAGFSFLLARLERKSTADWPVSRYLAPAAACITAGCLFGLHLHGGLTLHAGVPGGIFIVFGLSTIFVGVLYVAPPLNFSQRIGGEVVLAVGLGLIPVLGAYLVQVGDITRRVYLAALPLVAVTGLWVWTGELVSRAEDGRTGRRTMVMIFSLRFSGRYVTLALTILPYAALVMAVFARSSLEPLSLIALLSLGLALKVVSISWNEYADAAKMRRACAYAFAMHATLSLVICLSSLAVILL
jgi:1,4-dihydroxy-2-naphthoate octaprenyltransferase